MKILLLSTALFLTSTFLYAQGTVFKTATDYGNEKFTTYRSIIHEKKNLILLNNDESITVISLGKDKQWGYRSNWGDSYRFKNAKKAVRIIEFGAICIYANKEITATTSTPDIAPGWNDNPYALNKTHSFSIGPKGKIIPFSRAKFLKALRYDPKLYSKFEIFLDGNTSDLLVKIMEHNAGQN